MKSCLSRAMILAILSIVTPVTGALASAISDSSSKGIALTAVSAGPLNPGVTVKNSSFMNRYLYRVNAKAEKAKGGSIALVVISAVIISLLFAFVIFMAAWGGASSGLLAVIGIAGLGLIIFGASRIIRGIKRRQEQRIEDKSKTTGY